jgi:polysaccharide biosynthesis protein PslA
VSRNKDSTASIRTEEFASVVHEAPRAEILRFPDTGRASLELRQLISSRGLTLTAKRTLDVLVAGAAVLVLAVPLLLIAALVRVTSAGPAIFRQKRTGLNGSDFTILKFRTMYVELQDHTGIRHTVENDPRVTPVGKVLRKLSLDELPQLLNVLWGDMSIVGPRAHAVGMLALGVPYNVLVNEYDLRHLVRPGITGQAQINGYRGEVNDETHARGRIAEDLDYVRNMSIWRDLKIMALTLPAVMSGRAAF